jgi:glycosyltransferase involved in cell wall biosynthesis
MKDPALRQKMGAAGRVRATEKFDYRVVAKRFVEIINQRLNIY